MTMRQGVRRAGCGLLLAAALAACKQGDDGQTGLGTVRVDTANPSPLDGVSDTELQRQAQGLTPEQAAAQGVAVDTSIHIEEVGDSTAPAPAAAPVADSSP
jgi:hypothetical protein